MALGGMLLGFGAMPAIAAPTTTVDLGVASPYAVLSGASVGNTVSAPGAPHTTLRGDLGVKADTAPLGFPPGVVTGTIRHGSSVDPAHAKAVTAYNEIKNRAGGQVIAGAMVGAVLAPGLYTIAGAASNTGTVTLDGGGDPDAVFVFQVNGALSFAAASQVVLTNRAQASRVFWQVNGAGAIGAGAAFAGTLIATDAVAMGNGTFVNGRAFALNGALTLDNNQFYGAPPTITINGGETAYTTNTTPILFGTTDLDAPGQVTVTLAGQTLVATPVNGNWTVTSGMLPNGTYQVEAAVTDAAGNLQTALQELIIDTVLPTLILDGGPAVTTGASTPTLSGTSDVAANTVVRVSIGSQTLIALVQEDTSWNIRAAAVVDGTHLASVSVSDPAGNESLATQSITVDTTPPSVAISGGPDALTDDSTPTLTGFANVAPGTTIEVIVANQTLTDQVDGDQLWSVTAAALPDGLYRFLVVVTDAAGNQTQVEHLLTIDTTVPPVTVVDPRPSLRRLAVTPRLVPSSGVLTHSLTRLGPLVSLNLTEPATIRFEITGKLSRVLTFQMPRQGGASFIRIPRSIRRSLRVGSFQLTATATDSAGQDSMIERTSFRVIK